MINEFLPTKANLIKCQELLDFSIKGFELLDKKRNVLIRELMILVKDADRIQKKIDGKFQTAYQSLQLANIALGSNSVEASSQTISKERPYDVLLTSVMGVELPRVRYKEKVESPNYGFFRTNPAFDNCVKEFNELKYLIYQLAEIETSVYKLAVEIKKTKKRANALEKIQIPKYKKIIKDIEVYLEEKEREDFFRLKKIKDKKAQKSDEV